MKSDCIIIGGGISALMNAYHLNKAGLNITIIDKDNSNIENKTSFGNAGLLSAFSKTPLSHPRILLDTIELLFKKKSPLYLSSFLDLKTIHWSLRFFLSSTKKNTEYRMGLFEKYGEESFGHYKYMQEELGLDFDYHRNGFISIYSNKKKYLHQKKIFDKTPHKISLLDNSQIEKLCPIIDTNNIYGAFLLHKNAQLDPSKVLINLKTYLKKQGVLFIEDDIIDINLDKDKVASIVSNQKKYIAKNYILASGINTKLAKKLDTNLIQIPTKGYSITFDMKEHLKPKMPILLADKFIILTPRKDNTRVTSFLEIGSMNKTIDDKKIKLLISSLKEVTKDFDIKDIKPWCGFRPLTPNDKPLLGRDKKYKNFIYSMGLGWLGMTFGPAIGRIVSDLVIKDIDNGENEDIMLFSGL